MNAWSYVAGAVQIGSVLVGIVCRVVWERTARAEGMQVFGAGVIAGDALFAFFTSTWKATFR